MRTRTDASPAASLRPTAGVVGVAQLMASLPGMISATQSKPLAVAGAHSLASGGGLGLGGGLGGGGLRGGGGLATSRGGKLGGKLGSLLGSAGGAPADAASNTALCCLNAVSLWLSVTTNVALLPATGMVTAVEWDTLRRLSVSQTSSGPVSSMA